MCGCTVLGLTFGDLHWEGTLRDGLLGEGDVDGVGALHHGLVGAAEHIVSFVLQHDLHCVPVALGVNNDYPNISLTSACKTMLCGVEPVGSEIVDYGIITVNVFTAKQH